jgi:hypothetical protein
MLRELVAIFIRRMGDLSLGQADQSARQDLVGAKADANHAAASEMRKARLGRS